MPKLENLNPKRVFHYFEELCSIPRPSEYMEKIADYCESFAKAHSLRYVRDKANNVIIYKDGVADTEPIILQGHLDIVAQKTPDREIDFLKDGLDIYVDGGRIRARGTTLGADNGIAVAMILAILERDDLTHPPIEAVLTTDEEIGMIGAKALDFSLLKGKRMINLDSEEEEVMTISCAGGSDFRVNFDKKTEKQEGTKIDVAIKGLAGGHSGVEIHKGRVNANSLAGRFLNHLSCKTDFSIIDINGGDKANAITNSANISLCVSDASLFEKSAKDYIATLKNEMGAREENLDFDIKIGERAEYDAFSQKLTKSIIYTLLCAPQGVVDMSAEIEGLVETSLNLGILKTDEKAVSLHFALRSNKKSALKALEDKLYTFFSQFDCIPEVFGHYPPWEFNPNSTLQGVYKKAFLEEFGYEVKAEAIHAGLECGVFADGIENFDCIAIGPDMRDVHTVSESLSIASTEKIYSLLLKVLERLI